MFRFVFAIVSSTFCDFVNAASISVSRAPLGPFEWPDSEIGEQTPERISAAKHAAKYVACEVCTIQMIGVILEHTQPDPDEERIGEWIATSSLQELAEDAGGLCKLDRLMNNVEYFEFDLRTNDHGSVRFVRKGEDDGKPEWAKPTEQEPFNWRIFALHHACLETFRRGGDKIAKAIQKFWGTTEAGDEGNFMERVSRVATGACNRAKSCSAQHAEIMSETSTIERDKARAERDPAYSPELTGGKKLVKYDKHVNYYKVLGVDEYAVPEDCKKAARDLLPLYGSREGRELAGIDDAEGADIVRQLKSAVSLLSDNPSRRQYDYDRDRMNAADATGVKTREPDKLHFDGNAALVAFEDEFQELAAMTSLKLTDEL